MKTCDSWWGIFIYSGNAYERQEKVINKPTCSAAESQIFSSYSLQLFMLYCAHIYDTIMHKLIYIEMPHLLRAAEAPENNLGDLCSFQFFLRKCPSVSSDSQTIHTKLS